MGLPVGCPAAVDDDDDDGWCFRNEYRATLSIKRQHLMIVNVFIATGGGGSGGGGGGSCAHNEMKC